MKNTEIARSGPVRYIPRVRADLTMQEFRAMTIYTANDPRHPLNYPSYQWFKEDKKTAGATPLKPTL